MNIIICDDCQSDREILKKLLREYEKENDENFEIIEYASGVKLSEDNAALKECRLIFLDIDMAETDGLKITMKIKDTYPDLPIVLVTADMSYAVEGYKVRASRFLLKNDLNQTIGECMDELLKEIKQKEQIVEYSFVEGKRSLRADEIIYVETSRHKNIFYTKKQTYSIYRKLDEIEADLKDMGFIRTHLSYLVNMRYIEKISSYVLRLTNGKEISVPKSRYPEVKRQYTLFKGME